MRAVLICIAVGWLSACAGDAPGQAVEAGGTRTGLRFLRTGDDQPGFSRATEPRAFQFPADHGSHPDFQTEWWYFTGNLAGPDGRPLGFQLTFFRFALRPGGAHTGASGWRSTQLWMAHFAVTDGARQRFFARERMAREAVSLAGATGDPLRVWVKDWSMESGTSAGGFSVHLQARDGDVGLDLSLTTRDAPVAHGEKGLDRKGPEMGNASYYYSIPRLAASGSVMLDGDELAVTGSAWLDREWSTSALSEGVAGWDWFALQLSNGGSLVFYRLRQEIGGSSPFSAGTLVSSDGAIRALRAEDVDLNVLRQWVSSATGARYPVAWSIAVPSAGLSLIIEPLLADQELDLSVRYWEGAVHANGSWEGNALQAVGYLELTGY
jgi:predicted secreted hydrolase